MCLQIFIARSKEWENCLPAIVPMQTNMIYTVQGFLLEFSVCLQDHA